MTQCSIIRIGDKHEFIFIMTEPLSRVVLLAGIDG